MENLNTTTNQLSFTYLKNKQRSERENYSEGMALRVHRSLSWLKRAELSVDDLDSQFIFLWISFNAAYGNEVDAKQLAERKVFTKFTLKLCEFDTENQLFTLLSHNMKNVESIFQNKYLHSTFWSSEDREKAEFRWKHSNNCQFPILIEAIKKKNSAYLIKELLSRIYLLRNQFMHGLNTYNSSVNREQVSAGVSILSELVPTILNLMMNNANYCWKKPSYPVMN